jgi:predicted O-methyltransferase YrrM
MTNRDILPTRSRDDLSALRCRAGGMLSLNAYERIYRSALTTTARDVVEIGTAHGAGTIACAWALLDRQSDGRVFTLDRLEGGSRAAYGDRSANERIVTRNLQQFGVEDRVELLVGEARDIGTLLPDNVEIGLLLLDSDGRIHRDIENLWDRLSPDALLVIDDFEPVCRLKRIARRHVRVDSKMMLTYEIASALLLEGTLRRVDLVGRTLFAQRAADQLPDGFGEMVLAAYDKLVFIDGTLPTLRSKTADWLRASHPTALNRLRSIVRRSEM